MNEITAYCYISEIDGALVVEIDGNTPAHIRVNLNDNLIAEVPDVTDLPDGGLIPLDEQ